MSVQQEGATIWQRLRSPAGFTATANYFVMDWAAIWIDIVGGLLIAGALAAWVPESWWQAIFFEDHPTFAKFWGPLIGPLIAILSFVCSIGNVPLAAVLWNGGISFGGVLAFIFADLIVLPILDIYRKYYGWRMAGFLLATFYATMVAAGLIVEFLFQGLWPRSNRARRQGCRGQRHLELHDRSQHHLLEPRCGARLALFQTRRRRCDAANDEHARRDGAWTRAHGSLGLTRIDGSPTSSRRAPAVGPWSRVMRSGRAAGRTQPGS